MASILGLEEAAIKELASSLIVNHEFKTDEEQIIRINFSIVTNFSFDKALKTENVWKVVGEYLLKFFEEKGIKTDFIGRFENVLYTMVAEEICSGVSGFSKEEGNAHIPKVSFTEFGWDNITSEEGSDFLPGTSRVVLVDIYPANLQRAYAICERYNIKVEAVVLMIFGISSESEIIRIVGKNFPLGSFYCLLPIEKILATYFKRLVSEVSHDKQK